MQQGVISFEYVTCLYYFKTMKKGKRQILQKNFFDNDETQLTPSGSFTYPTHTTAQSTNPTAEAHFETMNNHTQQESSEPSQPRQPKPPNRKGDNRSPGDNISISPNSEQRNVAQAIPHSTHQNSSTVVQEKDEKKSRIELLKQKYLKKAETKSKEPEPAQQPPQREQTKPQNKGVPAVEQLPVQKEDTSRIQPPKIQQISEPTKAVINKREYKPEVESPVKVKIQEAPQKQDNDDKDEQQIVEKKVQTKVFKVPPPPSAKKGQKVPAPPVPARPRQVLVDQPEPQDQPSLSQINPPPTKLENDSSRSPPRRPGSRPNSVQQIIAKRLKKQDPIIQRSPDLSVEEERGQDQHHTGLMIPSRSMPLDEQYLDKTTEAAQTDQQAVLAHNLSQESYEFDVHQAIRVWFTEPDNFFQRVLPRGSTLLEVLHPRNHELSLSSKNPGFNKIVSKMLVEFVFKGQVELTISQKQTVSDLSLEFFYSSLTALTTQFLLVVVKLGPNYLTKYAQFFRENLNAYCLTILNHKQHYLPQELAAFVDFVISTCKLQMDALHLLILLQPTEQLTSLIFSSTIEDQHSILLSLGACHRIFKSNNSVLGIYFKLISFLIDTIPQQTALLQGTLKYINQIETHEKYYQLQKQLKLKLINVISNSVTQQQPPESKEKESKEGKGLMSIWNKAVDKIKTATTQLTEKEKPKAQQAQEPEAPEDDITYDPVLKRYLINGKVPDDEDSRGGASSGGNPKPPPPPKANKPVAPPPPRGGAKARTVTAVNRYA